MASQNDHVALINRREAIQRVSMMFGGVALVGHSALLDASEQAASLSGALLEATDVALLDEIAETILPETETPGAKEAGVGPFMALMVADAYSPDEQKIFREGMATLERECEAANGKGFLASTPSERLSLLEKLDREQHSYMKSRDDGQPVHYFRMMKELALLGYFTSEIGYKKAMRYVETPGRFEPCVPYEPGDKAWARHA